MDATRLRLGTRGSALALTQSNFVAATLKSTFPALEIEIQIIKTTGDKITDTPLSRIGVKGLFIKEIEEALEAKKIDFAVHSLKDLATNFPKGLCLGAVLQRENPADCFITRKKLSLKQLPSGSTIGTSSLRRQAQLYHHRPDLKIENLRGNLDTRIRKLKEGQYDGIIVARAGVKRLASQLQLQDVQIEEIPFEQMLPAVGQGSLAIEVRENDEPVQKLVDSLNHRDSHIAALAERALLLRLEGGCQIPVGAICKVDRDEIVLEAMIASLDGKQLFRDRVAGPAASAEEIGVRLAEKLLDAGGAKILEQIRG